MIGIILLFILSIIFGLAFTVHKDLQIEKLKSQLLEKDAEIKRTLEQSEFEKRVLKNTIRELM